MKTVTLTEAQEQLSRLIELVEAGKDVTITREGIAVARLTAVPQLPGLAEFRAQQPWQNESAGEFMRRLRDTDRY